uniref:Uncharacterized protein n=1 Tax=Trichogramma kaykai TaxID=54128 RepID=A0ABD2XBE9_9HYME
MSLAYYFHLWRLKLRLRFIRDPRTRRQEYRRLFKKWLESSRGKSKGLALLDLINCTKLFPSVEDKEFFLKFGVDEVYTEIFNQLRRGNFDVDEFKFENGDSDEIDQFNFDQILKYQYINEEFDFHFKPEVLVFLARRYGQLKPVVQRSWWMHQLSVRERIHLTEEVEKLKTIEVAKNVTLFRLCQLDDTEAALALGDVGNWRVPSLQILRCSCLSIAVKRHLANVLARSQLQLDYLAADILSYNMTGGDEKMTFRANLEFSYSMNDENLFHFFDQMCECNMERPCIENIKYGGGQRSLSGVRGPFARAPARQRYDGKSRTERIECIGYGKIFDSSSINNRFGTGLRCAHL